MELWPGRPAPLGATYDGSGTNFSIFSEIAERVELCLFDDEGHEERHPLPERTGFVWHGYAPEVSAGQHYGYRVHGQWEPADGRRANPAKLLVDPYAKAVVGDACWSPALQDHRPHGRAARRHEVAGRPRTTMRPSPRARWSSTPGSTGAPIAHRPPRGTTASSTRPTSRGSRGSTPRSPRTYEGRSSGWPTRRSSSTSTGSA